jgi:hypothetical protein
MPMLQSCSLIKEQTFRRQMAVAIQRFISLPLEDLFVLLLSSSHVVLL